jgi:hypothetical protein
MPHVIQIMFETKTGLLERWLYVRQITNSCDGRLNSAPTC